MTNITNKFEKGSCVFEAGSTMNGDVHISNCTFHQVTPNGQQRIGKHVDAASPNASDKPTRGHGYLFALDGKDTEEDTKTRNRERMRFLSFLANHHLGSQPLSATMGTPLNDAVVCFVLQWQERGLTSHHPSGRAVYRFLTDHCGLESTVTIESYGNKMNDWLRDKRYQEATWQKVKEAFGG